MNQSRLGVGRWRQVSALGLVSVGIAVVGVATTTSTAWIFGATRPIEIFFAASGLLATLQKLFMTGQLSEVFLPQYVQLRASKGTLVAHEAFAVVINVVGLSSCAVAAVMGLCLPFLIDWFAPGFNKTEQALMIWCFLMILPATPLQIANALIQMIGNAERWYGRFEVYVLGGAVGSLLALWSLRSLGLWSLIASVWIAQVVSLVGRMIHLKRNGYRHSWRLSHPDISIKALSVQMMNVASYVASTQFYLVVFTAALTRLPPGMLAIYKYAELIFQRLSALFLRPVSVVFYTAIASCVRTSDVALRLTRQAIADSMFLFAMIGGLISATAYDVIAALWVGPRLSLDMARTCSTVLQVLLVSLLFDSIAVIVRKLNMALDRTKAQYFANALMQVLSAMLVPFVVIGVLGAALSTILASLLTLGANGLVTNWDGRYYIQNLVPTRSVLIAIGLAILGSAAARFFSAAVFGSGLDVAALGHALRASIEGVVALSVVAIGAWSTGLWPKRDAPPL